MSTFILLFPLFLLGNIHCFGMCGPLVMTIGRHRYRVQYFLGRILAFSCVGMIAGEMGEAVTVYLKEYSLGAIAIILLGFGMFFMGFIKVLGGGLGTEWLANRFKGISSHLTLLMLQDRAWPLFLFGLCTVLLPCGQSLIVFSSCALAADPWIGLLCGFSLAFFTTPSLWLAMHASSMVKTWRGKEDLVIGFCGIAVGLLAMARGFAELGWIDHLRFGSHWVVY